MAASLANKNGYYVGGKQKQLKVTEKKIELILLFQFSHP